jgi:molybdopterin-guanine dinucleotide biosynthesis protein A
LNISGIILAGGKSSRMGVNKAFLQINGVKMIERVARILTRVCSEIIISGDEKIYGNLGYKVVPDIHPGCGPLSGIHAGLLAAANRYSFVSACDIPYPDEKIIKKLAENPENCDAILLYLKDHLEPLFSLYGKGFAKAAETSILRGVFKVTDALSLIRWKKVIITSSAMVFDQKKTMANINNPFELEQAKKHKKLNHKNFYIS